MPGLNNGSTGLFSGASGLATALTSGAGLFNEWLGLGGGSENPPTLQNVTVPMGAYTNKNSGGVYLRNIGLAVEGTGTASFWRISNIQAIGGGAASNLTNTCVSNTANSTARTPLPSLGTNTNLTVTLPATSYTMDVVAVGPNGAESNTAVLTFTVVADAFNRGDDPVRDGKDAFVNLDHDMGGKTMLISVGADYLNAPWSTTGTGLWNLQEIVGHTGRVTVEYADPARPAQVKGIDLISCQRIDIYGIGIGGGINHKIHIRDGGTNPDDVHLYDCYSLGASINDVSPTNSGQHSAINISANCSNCSVEGCSFEYMGRAVSIAGATGCTGNTVRNCKFRYHCSDALSVGTSTNTTVEGCVFVSPQRYGGDLSGLPDHVDSMQLSDLATISGVTIKSNMWIQADGNGAAIGLQGGQTSCSGALFENNIVMGRSITAANFGNFSGTSVVRDSTYFFTGSGLIGNTDVNANDNIWNSSPAQAIRSSGGSGSNTLLRVFHTGSTSLDASWTTTNSSILSLTYPNAEQFPYSTTPGVPSDPQDSQPTPVFDGSVSTPGVGVDTYDYSGHLNYTNARERLGNYDATVNPDGTDYANMTIDQIVAKVLDVLTPKAGGSLDLGGGVSIGAVTLGGSLKGVSVARLEEDSTARIEEDSTTRYEEQA